MLKSTTSFGLRSFERWSCLTLALGSQLLAAPSFAVDGVIEINQAQALAGDVTPGDAPGFPVTISQAGSYRLTSNLTPGANAGIEVTAHHVTLDLNGFSLIAPSPRSGYWSGIGIDARSQSDTSVSNGGVSQFSAGGIALGDDCRVHRVRATDSSGVGILVGSRCSVTESTANGNFQGGIVSSDGNLISGNTVVDNDGVGIFARTGNTVSGNVVSGGGADGIRGSSGNTINGNTVHSNAQEGIEFINGGNTIVGNSISRNESLGLALAANVSGASGYANNVLTSNNGGNNQPQVSGGVQMATNICGFNTVCP